MTENSENITNNSGAIVDRNPDGTFKPGHAKLGGKEKGQRDYATIYREALIKLGNSLNKTPDDLELELLQTGLLNAKKGDYRFYKDVLDRVHGTPVNTTKVDHTTQGEKLEVDIDVEAIAKRVAEELKQKKVYEKN